jgi:aspartate/methionine/tyrosine aminotransferase
MTDRLSPNLANLKASETVAISAEARRRKAAGEDVLDLGVGEPDFDTPSAAAQAGIQAIQQGHTRYPPNTGIAELRRAIAGHLSALSGGRPVDAERVIISSGSKQSLFNACFSLFGPKDKVLIPSPAWVSYPQIVHLSRAEPVMVPGSLEWGLKVSVKDLDAHDRLVRGLIICSPCNPTGAVYTKSEIRGDRRMGPGPRDLDHRRRDLPPHQLRGRPAASFLDLPDDCSSGWSSSPARARRTR